jgi:DNA-binding response OmpR family regulator
MSKPRGRILVIDDLPDWSATAVEVLRRAGYEAESADTLVQARICLDQALYHLLVLDICLEQDSNEDGLLFLRELDRQGLTDAIQVVMFSNYPTKERMRETFRDYRIADFIDKAPFDESRFVEDIRRVFTKNARINIDMNISWSQTSGPEAVVVNLKLEHKSDGKTSRVLANSPLQKRVATELEDLLRRLFHEAQSLLVRPMLPGRSGTGVLWVQPFYQSIGRGSAMVVKFGSASQIQEEYKNYKEFVERLVGGRHCTTIHDRRRTVLLGGISYSFLGANGPIEDFGSFYKSRENSQIKQALDHLFLTTCMDWYANTNRIELLDLTQDYQKTLQFTPEKLKNAFRQLRLVQRSDQEYLYPEKLTNVEPFINPLRAIAGRNLAFPTYTCPTHGDLNHHNLQVDKDGHIWMIDFQGTGQGHILRDFVALDSSVRFQLLTATDATLQERLEMEQALCSIKHFSEVDQLEGRFQTDNKQLAKAYDIVVHLRKLAAQAVRRNPNDDFNEYYAALLFNALNTLRFASLEQEQREYALLSASLLTRKLEIGI